MKEINKLRIITIAVSILLGVAIFVVQKVFSIDTKVIWIIYVVFVVILLILSILLTFANNNGDNKIIKLNKKETTEKEEKVDETIIEGNNITSITYDKDYNITSMSNDLLEKNANRINEKILNWLPDVQVVIDGTSDKCIVIIDDKKYEVNKDKNDYVLYFSDISKEYDLEKKVKDNAYVLGLCNFDNYNEDEEAEDTTNYVNANIKLPVMAYFKKYGIVYRTLRNNRLQLILNYKTYEELYNDHFSILNIVRKEAKKVDLNITLSMAFAYGSDDLSELDNEASSLIDITQNRGGDQVAVRQYGKEAMFYGGTSEAREKQSTVKVRAMTNTIKKLIKDSSNVIIVGHNDADSDCIGSMLAMACITKYLNKEAYVVTLSGEIEPTMKNVIEKYRGELYRDFKLVSEIDALEHYDDNSLVIMCDHHSISQSNSQTLLAKANRVMIIDHHRRKADLDVKALLLYVEASASSTCEMVSEFFTYLPKMQVPELVINIMYLGIIIDTDHFRTRTGMRTFDAAKVLKNMGADSQLVENMAQESYGDLKKRIKIINSATKFNDEILIAAVENDTYSRTIASKACDALIKINDIEAAFVICYSSKDVSIITARSKGKINVQVILEKLHGGGHMTAAGLQRDDIEVDELRVELEKVIYDYLAINGGKK